MSELALALQMMIHLVLPFEKLSLWPQLPVAPMGKKCNSMGGEKKVELRSMSRAW